MKLLWLLPLIIICYLNEASIMTIYVNDSIKVNLIHTDHNFPGNMPHP